MDDRLLTHLDVADWLALTPRQASRLMHRGDLPTVRISTSELRVPADALARWIADRTEAATGDSP